MAASRATSADQGERFSYFREAAEEGNERAMFERMLEVQAVPAEESEPYRRALDKRRSVACRLPLVPGHPALGPRRAPTRHGADNVHLATGFGQCVSGVSGRDRQLGHRPVPPRSRRGRTPTDPPSRARKARRAVAGAPVPAPLNRGRTARDAGPVPLHDDVLISADSARRWHLDHFVSAGQRHPTSTQAEHAEQRRGRASAPGANSWHGSSPTICSTGSMPRCIAATEFAARTLRAVAGRMRALATVRPLPGTR